jgi:hypothetical protein
MNVLLLLLLLPAEAHTVVQHHISDSSHSQILKTMQKQIGHAM